MVFGFENPRRRYGSGEGSPPTPPSPLRQRHIDFYFGDSPRVEHRVGEGGTSVDPYLLRVVEAADVSLVAGQRLHNGMRLSVVYGGPPSPTRRVETEKWSQRDGIECRSRWR